MKRALLLLALVVASCSDQPMPKVGNRVFLYGFDSSASKGGKVLEVRGTWVRMGDPNRSGEHKDMGYWVDVSRFCAISIEPSDW